MFADLKYVVFWWLEIFLLGCFSLPLVFYFFRQFWDRGYLFAKIVSLAIFTYLIFISGVIRLLPFSHASIYLLFLFALAINWYFLSRPGRWAEIVDLVKKNYRIFLFEEIIFLIILAGWSIVRGFAPDIEGLEKFMDWGFVNSMLRSKYMPPADMWFAGHSINYYYFGHLMFAFLTKLSGLSSAITYNLSIATACALTFSLTFSLSSNLVFLSQKLKNLSPVIISGLVSAFLLTFGGNLHAVYKIARINIQNEGRLTLTRAALSRASQSYWYPDATRFIGFDPDTKDKTIHEFPLYSFVVADLHGHMNDIPVVLFFLAFLLSTLAIAKTATVNWRLILVSGLTLSIAYMTNAWDFAVYGLFFAVSCFIHKSHTINPKSALAYTFTNGLLIILFWYLFTLPFSLNFTPMAEGLRLSDARTPFYQLFVLYGGFWLICLPFVFYFLKLLITDYRLLITKTKASDAFVISLILTATILVIIPEIGYIKDIYIYEHRRANTMFKLVYQAFMLYSLVSGYVVFRLRSYWIYKIIFFFVFISHMLYPYFATKSYYGFQQYRGLWGLGFLKNQYPDNLAAINWLNQNIDSQPVILEATGDSYTTFNQVSMATGLPTVEGWLVHEWLWRGGYDEPGARSGEVQRIYEAKTPAEALPLLQKYSVKYVFLGDKEREKYPNLNEKLFDDLGAKTIFQSGQTKIYQLP